MRRASCDAIVGADFRVVAGHALADVVQQRAEQQQFGAAARARDDRVEVAVVARSRIAGVEELGADRDRFQQVPVDGEAVVRVALRARPHVLPLREAGARGRLRDRAPRTPGPRPRRRAAGAGTRRAPTRPMSGPPSSAAGAAWRARTARRPRRRPRPLRARAAPDTGGSSVTMHPALAQQTRPRRATRSRCATRLLGPSRWSRTRLHTSWLTHATSRAERREVAHHRVGVGRQSDAGSATGGLAPAARAGRCARW